VSSLSAGANATFTISSVVPPTLARTIVAVSFNAFNGLRPVGGRLCAQVSGHFHQAHGGAVVRCGLTVTWPSCPCSVARAGELYVQRLW
jgi:hypothetical protein